jgi:hypothetical protein
MYSISDVQENKNVALTSHELDHMLDQHTNESDPDCLMCFPKPINETPRTEPRFFLVSNEYFSASNLPPQEELCLHAHRGTLVLIQSITNAGKSTFVRNLSFALATGEPFGDLIPENSQPHKVMLLNMEHTDPRSDLAVMRKHFAEDDLWSTIEENFAVAHPQIPVSLSTTEGWERIRDAARKFEPDVIVLDTFVASFDVRNENDNSEVTKLVKRVLGLAREFNALVILTHHIGKAVVEEGRTRDIVHRGRGASALAAAASSIFNLDADARDWRRVRLSCAKNKTGKGAYSAEMFLGENRWFTFIPSQTSSVDSRHDKILSLLAERGEITTEEIADALEVTPRTIRREMTKIASGDKRFSSPKKGVWVWPQEVPISSDLNH